MNKKDKQEIEKLMYVWDAELRNYGQKRECLTTTEESRNLIEHFISDLESLRKLGNEK